MRKDLVVRGTVSILIISSLYLSGCASDGMPGASGLTGVTYSPTTSNSRQKARFNACETTGTCNMSDAEARHATRRSQLDERKSLADWKTRKRGEDVRRDELYNDSLESDVRRKENANSVGAMGDTIDGYSRAAGGVGNLIDNVGRIFK